MNYTANTAVEALDRANPVPDPENLTEVMVSATVFLATERNDTLDTKEHTQQDNGNRSKNRGLLVSAAVFASIVVVGAIVFIAMDTTTSDTAGYAPQDTVDAFIDARSNGDADAALALLAEDALIYDQEEIDEEAYAARLAWLGALEWKWDVLECSENPVSETAASITCTYEHNNAWGRALGVGPFNELGAFEFEVVDGEITEFTHRWSHAAFSPAVWETFIFWAEANHPELIALILSDGCCTPITTADANEVWRTLTLEYVAELNS
ncbi:MAG: hypothetical protein ACR2N2_02690 [Acidimicrobiia bacterium]